MLGGLAAVSLDMIGKVPSFTCPAFPHRPHPCIPTSAGLIRVSSPPSPHPLISSVQVGFGHSFGAVKGLSTGEENEYKAALAVIYSTSI